MNNIRSRISGLISRFAHRRTLSWVLADQLVVSAGNFLTSIVVARALGINQFGIFSFAWIVVLFAQSIQIAVIISPMMSMGPKQPADTSQYYYTTALIQQLILSIVQALLIVIAGGIDANLSGILGISVIAGPLAVCIAVTQLHDFLRRYNFTVGNTRSVFLSDLIRNLTQLVALQLCLYRWPRLGVGGTLAIIALAAAVGCAALARAFRIQVPRIATVMSTSKRHFHFSKWLVGSALLQWTTGNFFVIAAGAILGPAAVGALRASQNVVAITQVFFQAAENILPARAAQAYQKSGVPGLKKFVIQLTLVGGLLTGVVCIGIAIPADFWIRNLFGQTYVGLAFTVRCYALTYFVLALSMPLRFAFLAVENTKPIFSGLVLATAFTLSLSYPIVSHFGLRGAVLGFLASYVILFINLSVTYRYAFRTR